MTTDPARIAGIRAQLAALSAELDDLTNDDTPSGPATDDCHAGGVESTNAAFEQNGDIGKPRQETAEDAIAEARRRGGGRTRSEQLAAASGADSASAPSAPTDDGRAATAAHGRAAARRRLRQINSVSACAHLR